MSASKSPMPSVPFGNITSHLPTYEDVMARGADRAMPSSSGLPGYNIPIQYPTPCQPQYYAPPPYPPQGYAPQPYPAAPQPYPYMASPARPNIPAFGGLLAREDNRHARRDLKRLGKMERRELKREEKVLKWENKLERRAMKDGLWMGPAPSF
ncbi:hypothetical protein CALCODRAFT_504016 [Calocera cornea HHB12733]|uniref:Uncharacterized protein n=1 Tax=Calocera cornea HHB12733 TaxID=1353952 RepID=A0A165CM34_9BASI|nr:hypothetical protein CALCODRAFT_504016 [Calocera cornea HHB12733]